MAQTSQQIWFNPRRWKKRYRVTLAVCIFVTASLIIYAPSIISLFYFLRLSAEISALPPAPPIASTDRLLIIAPHPDDETLACSAAILQAKQVGAKVEVVWLTCGDGFEWDEILLSHSPRPPKDDLIDLGRKRADEARAAMAELRLNKMRKFFLGYPDGSLLRMFLDYYARPCTSRYTRCSAVPYDFAKSPGAEYTGQTLERDLRAVIRDFDPTVVLCPAIQDHHPDHRAAAYFAMRLMGERGQIDRLRWYIVHGGLEWPMPKGFHPQLPMGIPPRGLHLRWQRVELSEDMREAKKRALDCYISQRRAVGGFLSAFERTNELQALDLSLEPVPPETQQN